MNAEKRSRLETVRRRIAEKMHGDHAKSQTPSAVSETDNRRARFQNVQDELLGEISELLFPHGPDGSWQTDQFDFGAADEFTSLLRDFHELLLGYVPAEPEIASAHTTPLRYEHPPLPQEDDQNTTATSDHDRPYESAAASEPAAGEPQAGRARQYVMIKLKQFWTAIVKAYDKYGGV